MNDSDMQIVRQAIDGDQQAFYAVVSARKRRLNHIAYSYLKNETDALEAIQETTYRAWLNRRKVKEPQYFDTWLIRILINYCIDEQKRKKRTLPLLHVPSSAETAKYDEHKLDLEMALQRLKPNYRHAIILKYYEEITFTEIATILRRPEGTIKTWLYKALQQLQEHLSKGGGYGL